nr:flagellar protein FliS [uncultured Acetatifactor sp.]
MTKERKQQYTLKISQANSTQLVVILYEMLLDYLEEGRQAHEADAQEDFKESIRKARGCLNELLSSLNLEYEPAPSLRQLYLFCIKRLAFGEGRYDSKPLEEIEKVIRPLHDAYEKIAPMNENGPLMNNSQAVYAGLTYGRNTLTENMTDQGSNRGMLA